MAPGNPVAMTIDPKTRRDLAVRRVRRATAAVVAGSAALTGVFFGVAKASTHSSAKSTGSTTTTKTTTTSGTVTAPTPSLVQNGSSQSSTPTQQTTTTPSIAQSAPVVVSGGS